MYRNKEIDDQELNGAISGFDENYSYFHVEPCRYWNRWYCEREKEEL